MSFQNQLKSFKTELDRELKKYLDRKLREAKKVSPFAQELMSHVAELTLRGGKRVRAALLYNSYLAHGGKNRKMALQAAMSMEMAESYLLIHDDIMDNGTLRRGGPTIHEIYRQIADERYHDRVNASGFGVSIAICAGNIASALSCEIISNLDCNDADKNRALKLLSDVYVLENYGQSLDMISQVSDNIGQDDIIKIHKLKTVPYTFDGPVKIGAILAGASQDELKKLEQYTVSLGVAYQIQDDILGLFGSVEKVGKQITSDLKEGKKTLLILDALEKADKNQRDIIINNLGNKSVTISALKAVRKVVEETGALKKSKQAACDLVKKSIETVTKLKFESEGKKFLIDIAEYIIAREY